MINEKLEQLTDRQLKRRIKELESLIDNPMVGRSNPNRPEWIAQVKAYREELEHRKPVESRPDIYIKNVEAKLQIANARNARIRKSLESLTELLKASDAEVAYLSKLTDEFDDGGEGLNAIREALNEEPELKDEPWRRADGSIDFDNYPVWCGNENEETGELEELFLYVPEGYDYAGGTFRIVQVNEFAWTTYYEDEEVNQHSSLDGAKADVMETIGYKGE